MGHLPYRGMPKGCQGQKESYIRHKAGGFTTCHCIRVKDCTCWKEEEDTRQAEKLYDGHIDDEGNIYPWAPRGGVKVPENCARCVY